MSSLSRFSPIFLRGLPLFIWMGVIFFFSSLPGSEHPYQITLSYYMERKGAHIIEYAVLMLLTVRFATAIYSRETFEKILLLAAVFSITYGVSDEFHQFFVPYRGAKMSDVLIDGLGALLIGASLWLIMNIRYRKR